MFSCPAQELSEAASQYARAYELEHEDGDPRQALSWYEEAIDGAAQNEEILLGKALLRSGICLMKLGKYDQAENVWSDLRKRFPGSTSASRAADMLKRLYDQPELRLSMGFG